MRRSHHGFTLVELLVVITILGILMALIIPVVNTVREQARQTVCMSNQKQIATALLAYDVAKRHLPGVVNVTGSPVTVAINDSSSGTSTVPEGNQAVTVEYSWAAAIFPHLDKDNLYSALISGKIDTEFIEINHQTSPGCPDQYRAGGVLNLGNERVNVLVCPDDPRSSDPSQITYGFPAYQSVTTTTGTTTTTTVIQSSTSSVTFSHGAAISYSVNDGFFVSYTPNFTSSASTAGIPPIDRFSITQSPPTVSNLKSRPSSTYPRGQSVSTSTTIMLGERTNRDAYVPIGGTTSAGYYSVGSGGVGYGYFAGKWTDTPQTYGPISAYYSGDTGNYPPLVTFAYPQYDYGLPANGPPPTGIPWPQLTFHWPLTTETPPAGFPAGGPLPISPYIMVSTHPNKVVVTFFDGHSQIVNADTTYPQ